MTNVDALIERLRNIEAFNVGATGVAYGVMAPDSMHDEAADALEEQARRIAELERNADAIEARVRSATKEECAKVCLELVEIGGSGAGGTSRVMAVRDGISCAAAIRAIKP
jgi:hypothetical protein